jgi:hypothetical protein
MTRAAAYRQVRRSYWPWVRAVSHEIRNEVRRETIDIDTGEVIEAYPPGERSQNSLRRAMESRASKLVRCMRRVEGRVCGSPTYEHLGCGRPRSRGVFRMKEARHGKRVKAEYVHSSERCHLRSCPRCARIRAANYHAYGEQLADLFASNRDDQIALWGSHDYRAKLVTLTSVRDPADPEAHTVAALRERIAGLHDALRAILAWVRSDVREPGWVGAFRSVELAGTGHVHLHVLYHGPFVDLERWVAVGREGFTDRRGRVSPGFSELGSVGDVREADEETIAEVAKYPLKTPGSGERAGEWIGGKAVECIHPILVARWEVATYGMRLVERYGLCRQVAAPDEEAENEETLTPEAPIAPCLCGYTETKIVVYPTREWISLCRVAHVAPFGTPRTVCEAKETG